MGKFGGTSPTGIIVDDFYRCGHCKTPNAPSVFYRNHPHRCARCGSVHNKGEVISPFPHPVGEGTKAMPWMLPTTRPILSGFYEAKFSDAPGQVIGVIWDGLLFRYGDKRVDMSTFQSWRGEW